MTSKRSFAFIMMRTTFVAVFSAALIAGFGSPEAKGETSRTARKEVTLTFVGDVLPYFWPVQRIFETMEEQQDEQAVYDYSFQNVKKEFRGITFCNLEGPLTDEGPKRFEDKDEKAYFSVPQRYVNTLKNANIAVVSLANNHIKDCGAQGVLDTVNTLDENGILHAGAGRNAREARKPAIVEHENQKIAYLAYSLVKPLSVWATRTTEGAAHAEKNEIVADIKKAGAAADIVVVYFHWGQEYGNDDLVEPPQKEAVELARAVVDAGADIVIGSHSHAVERIETYKNKLIAYGLGNFVFTAATNEGHPRSIILRAKVATDKKISYEIVPVVISPRKAKYRPFVMEGKEANEYRQLIAGL
jgi:poly-gamma-glutamate synthesis protein (capsule biosynthesis protein)